MEWSKYQEAIFDFASNGSGNAIVEAVAGSGKTTTIVEAMNRIAFEYTDSVFLAFNKSIATELQSRGVDARTFHSLCYGPVTRYKGTRQVNANKMYSLCKQHLSDAEFNLYYSFIKRLIGLTKQMNYSAAELSANVHRIAAQYGIELHSEHADEAEALRLLDKMFAIDLRSKMVDFDDLLYIGASNKVTLPRFDFIFVDEAQDTNAVQHAILAKIMHRETRLIAVGDPRQAIYGFRGADTDSLPTIARRFACQSFPLTVSYRCPTSVVEFANTFVPGTETFEGAPKGKVENLRENWSAETFKTGDMILSRTNAPLVSIAYTLIIAGKKPKIMGREIGENLIKIIKDRRATGIPDLSQKMVKWFEREVGKIMAKAGTEEPNIQPIQDKYDCIAALIECHLDSSLEKLLAFVKDLFSEKGGEILLSTIHKAKGLEAKNVYWINHYHSTPWAKQGWEFQQENNLRYVAATRSQENLYLISYE